MTSEGKFKLEFDYDHLPAFNIIPEPERWLDEFQHHPRVDLQSKIQDWIDGKTGPAVIVERLKEFQHN